MAPAGNDSNSGTEEAPFQTIGKCSTVAVAGDACVIHAGVYRESISPTHSGETGRTIRYVAAPGTRPVITAFDPLIPGNSGVGTWTAVPNHPNVVKITLPAGYDLGLGKNQVRVGGTMLQDARWPNTIHVYNLKRNQAAISTAGAPTGPASGTYDHPLLQPVWMDARINMSLGKEWTSDYGKVTASTAGQVAFDDTGGDFSSDEIPAADDPFYLWNTLEALDAEDEFFFDTATDELHLFTNVDPGSLAVEIKTNRVNQLSGKKHIEIIGLDFMGLSFQSSSTTSHILVDDLRIKHSSYCSTGAVMVGFEAFGTDMEIRNSVFIGHTGPPLQTTGSSMRVTIANNLFTGGRAPSLNGGTGIIFTRNTVSHTEGHGVLLRAKTSEVSYNDVSHFGQWATDIAGINSMASGTAHLDLLGSQIHHNLVHDGVGYKNPLGGHNGARGIRFDNGFTVSAGNGVIHHNVIFNLTDSGGINIWPIHLTYPLTPQSYPPTRCQVAPCSYIRVYNNTLLGGLDINIKADNQSSNLPPTGYAWGYPELINNIVDNFNMATFPPEIIVENNLVASRTYANNLRGKPTYLDAEGRDYRLVAGSAGIDQGQELQPFSDGWTGTHPDIGAFELGEPQRIHGVQPVKPNRAPVAVADTATTRSTSWVNISVMANDQDPDGDTLEIMTINGMEAVVGLPVSVAPGGSATVLGNGTINFLPNPGYTGEMEFPVSVSDGRLTSMATVQVSVVP